VDVLPLVVVGDARLNAHREALQHAGQGLGGVDLGQTSEGPHADLRLTELLRCLGDELLDLRCVVLLAEQSKQSHAQPSRSGRFYQMMASVAPICRTSFVTG